MENKIPEEFHCYDTKKPFEVCMICQESLFAPPKQYMVEKSIRRYPDLDHTDVIYEYAMCIQCAMKQQEYISQESLENIMNYLQKITPYLPKNDEERAIPTTCSVYETSINEMTEYLIQGTFMGDKIDLNIPFLLFGEMALSDMQELLSAKTRDGMDDFMDQWFSGPPEFRELIKERKTVLI